MILKSVYLIPTKTNRGTLMANIRLITSEKQDQQRKRLHKAGMVKGAIDKNALEIGLNKMISDLERREAKVGG